MSPDSITLTRTGISCRWICAVREFYHVGINEDGTRPVIFTGVSAVNESVVMFVTEDGAATCFADHDTEGFIKFVDSVNNGPMPRNIGGLHHAGASESEFGPGSFDHKAGRIVLESRSSLY